MTEMRTAEAATSTTALTQDGPGAETSPEASSGRGLTFLSKAVKGRGYARVGSGPVAAGTLPGVGHVRVIVPIERVVVAELRARFGGVKLSSSATVVSDSASGEFSAVAAAALTGAAHACALLAGEVSVEVRLPIKASSGTDLLEASALAVIDAVAKVTETPLDAAARHTLAAEAVSAAAGRSVAGLAAGAPALVDASGAAVVVLRTGRIHVLIAMPLTGSQNASDDAVAGTETVLNAPGEDLAVSDAIGWLAQVDGGSEHPVAIALRECLADCGLSWPVIGGHGPAAAVLVLLDPAQISLSEQQQLASRLRAALPEKYATWQVSMTKTATVES